MPWPTCGLRYDQSRCQPEFGAISKLVNSEGPIERLHFGKRLITGALVAKCWRKNGRRSQRSESAKRRYADRSRSCLRTHLDFSSQPGSCQAPPFSYGTLAHPQDLGGFARGEPREYAKFDDLREPRIDPAQPPQSSVNGGVIRQLGCETTCRPFSVFASFQLLEVRTTSSPIAVLILQYAPLPKFESLPGLIACNTVPFRARPRRGACSHASSEVSSWQRAVIVR
jgi:hypothetical protein